MSKIAKIGKPLREFIREPAPNRVEPGPAEPDYDEPMPERVPERVPERREAEPERVPDRELEPVGA